MTKLKENSDASDFDTAFAAVKAAAEEINLSRPDDPVSTEPDAVRGCLQRRAYGLGP